MMKRHLRKLLVVGFLGFFFSGVTLADAADQPPNRTPDTAQERVVRAFSILPYLTYQNEQPRGKTRDDAAMDRYHETLQQRHRVLRELLDQLSAFAEEDLPQLMLHEPTMMLICCGPEDSIELVRTVVDALPGIAEQ